MLSNYAIFESVSFSPISVAEIWEPVSE